MTGRQRYITQADQPETGWWAPAKATDSLAKTVYETEPVNHYIGILDASGVKIFRVEPKEPIGFIHHVKTDKGCR